jgi:hypothetical protein
VIEGIPVDSESFLVIKIVNFKKKLIQSFRPFVTKFVNIKIKTV